MPIVSEWDTGYLHRRHGEDFVVALRKAYNRAVIAKARTRLKGSLRPAVRQGTTTKIVLRLTGASALHARAGRRRGVTR